ncbi:MAG: NTP transferase domain-containing protein [bacterium]
MTIAACVLAAGAGKRMGAPKALVTIDGRALLDLILESLSGADVSPSYVVTRPDAHAVAAIVAARGATLVVNPAPERGMLSSIHACLDAIATDPLGRGADALLVAPVDCPHVSAATIGALIAEFARTRAPIVVPCYRGRRGHPVIFSRALFGELAAAPLDIGARAVVRAHARDRIEFDVDDPAVLDDFDHPRDLPSRARIPFSDARALTPARSRTRTQTALERNPDDPTDPTSSISRVDRDAPRSRRVPARSRAGRRVGSRARFLSLPFDWRRHHRLFVGG